MEDTQLSIFSSQSMCAPPAAVRNNIIWEKTWPNGFQPACGGTVLLNSYGMNYSSPKISFTSQGPAGTQQDVLKMYSHMLPNPSYRGMALAWGGKGIKKSHRAHHQWQKSTKFYNSL